MSGQNEDAAPGAADGRPDADGRASLLQSVGFLARSVQILTFEAFFDALSDTGLTPAVHATLFMVRQNPGVRQGVVANALHILDPNMTKLVRGLMAAELIEKQNDHGDKRAVSLRLTPKGQAYLASVDSRIDDLEDVYTGGLADDERAMFVCLLQRVHANLSARRKDRQLSAPEAPVRRARASSTPAAPGSGE